MSHPNSDESSSSIDKPAGNKSKRRVINIGDEFQATIPNHNSRSQTNYDEEKREEVLWTPIESASMKELEDLIRYAIVEHNYNEEQVLAVYQLCDGNVEESKQMMNSYVPFGDSWSDYEKAALLTLALEEKKDFQHIHSTHLQRRSIGEIVNMYYCIKKRALFIFHCEHMDASVRMHYLSKCRAASCNHIPDLTRRNFVDVETAFDNESDARHERRARRSAVQNKFLDASANAARQVIHSATGTPSKRKLLSSSTNAVGIITQSPGSEEPSSKISNGSATLNTAGEKSSTQHPQKDESGTLLMDKVTHLSSSGSTTSSISPEILYTVLRAQPINRFVFLQSACYGFSDIDRKYIADDLWAKHDRLTRLLEYETRCPGGFMNGAPNGSGGGRTLSVGGASAGGVGMTAEQRRVFHILTGPPEEWKDSVESVLIDALFSSKGLMFSYDRFSPHVFGLRVPFEEPGIEPDSASCSSNDSSHEAACHPFILHPTKLSSIVMDEIETTEEPDVLSSSELFQDLDVVKEKLDTLALECERLDDSFSTQKSALPQIELSAVWREWEVHMLLMSVSLVGLDYHRLSDYICSKTASQIKMFVETHRVKLEIDKILPPPPSSPCNNKRSKTLRKRKS